MSERVAAVAGAVWVSQGPMWRRELGALISFSLALLALRWRSSFMFGAPTYSLIFHAAGDESTQFALSLGLCADAGAIAALAGIGLHVLCDWSAGARRGAPLLFGICIAGRGTGAKSDRHGARFRQISPASSQCIEPVGGRQIWRGRIAAFADGRMFFSYQLPQLLYAGALLLVSWRLGVSVGRAESLAALGGAGADCDGGRLAARVLWL